MIPHHPDRHLPTDSRNNSFRFSYSAQPRWVVVDGWLERDGEQILAGPAAVLEQFADYLELLNPRRAMLPAVLEALTEQTRGSCFTVGEALRRMSAWAP